MNCPRCGQKIMRWRRRCEFCGQDISVYERLQRLSNGFYNKGLERAKVRDLSGAIIMLKKSLEINKENTEARNLLGLVYFEIGEVVAAISEWVISQNYQPEDNKAAYFLKKVQSDTVALDSMNQTIKKYNIALANAKRHDDDLAVLQLKRVISVNPKFVQALLLLALVYLRNCEYEKAKRCLVRVQKIDVSNITAMRYMEEVRLNTQQGNQNASDAGKETTESSGLSQMVSINSYQEDKPNFMAFITFFLGILIGVAVIYYMAVPNIRKSIMADYNQKERDYSAVISSKDVTISSLESNIRILENKISDLERTLSQEEWYNTTNYAPLLQQLYLYQMYTELEEPAIEQTEELIEGLSTLDMSGITEVAAISLYEEMEKELKSRASAWYFDQGMEFYAKKDKEAALPLFEKAYDYTPNDPEVLYHLARIYHGLDDFEQAKALYKMLIEDHKDSTRSQEAETYLRYIEEEE